MGQHRKGPDGKIGIRGRKIVWKYYDDGYNPAQTVQLTNKLILEDKIFADVGSLGTEHNQAIRPLLNDRKIPQILVATGRATGVSSTSSTRGRSAGSRTTSPKGARTVYWIAKNAPNAKIAIFYQNDDYGKDYLRGLKIGLGAKKSLIVSEQSYEVTDTSYASQTRSAEGIRSGHVGTALHFRRQPCVRLATAKALNWKPSTIVINSVAALDSVMAAIGRTAGADVRQRRDQLRLPEEQLRNPKYAERPGRHAVHPALGAVRAEWG